jgi:hypothetical protein
MSFEPLKPREFRYVDAKVSSEQLAVDNLAVYIRMLEDRIFKAKIALAEGKPASEVVRILQG